MLSLKDKSASIFEKYRINITLKDIKFKTDCHYKNAQTLSSQVGNIAFDIERSLLLNILNDYYGLTKEKIILLSWITLQKPRLKID